MRGAADRVHRPAPAGRHRLRRGRRSGPLPSGGGRRPYGGGMTPAIHRWPPAVLIAAALWAAAAAAGSALGRGGGALDLVVLAVGLTAGGFLAIPLANGSSVPVGRALLLPLAASSPMAVFLVVAPAAQPAQLALARADGAPSGARRWAASVAVAVSAGAAYRLIAWLAPSGAWPALVACAAAVAVAACFDP